MTRVVEGRVAVRIRRVGDRGRRVVRDETEPAQVREEWRCLSCGQWTARESVTLQESGREVAGAPEISAYCTRCRNAPRLRGER